MRAFSDESERADRMLVGIVFVPTDALGAARTELRGLLLPGERRIHTAKESPHRRRALLDLVNGLDLRAVVLRLRRPVGLHRIEGRSLLLEAATGIVVGSGASAWTLDDQDPAQCMRDRASIAHALAGLDHRAQLVYDHRPGHAEPLPWAADALCWAAGAGPAWRRRVAGIVQVRDISP